ncbi:MAG: hypothetical protein KDA79_07130 [Planctomycetaceae bacterium]|nr:hypothetical protein [Planctomycetaceae bacterium]
MLRFLLAMVTGTIVIYAWGMAAWMALPIHDGTLHRLPDPTAITQALRAQQLKGGLYTYPAMPEHAADATAEQKAAEMKEFTDRHLAGPLVTVIYHPEGGQPMPPEMLVRGLAIDVVAVFLVCLILVLCGPIGFVRRLLIVVLVGGFAATVSHVALWNWMYFPLDYTVAMVLDVVLGWALTGLFLALILRKKTPAVG